MLILNLPANWEVGGPLVGSLEVFKVLLELIRLLELKEVDEVNVVVGVELVSGLATHALDISVGEALVNRAHC